MAESIEIKGRNSKYEEENTEDDDRNDDNDYDRTPRKKRKGRNTDFLKMGGGLITSINYKVSFMLFIVSMLIFSDLFIDNVLNKFNDTVTGECTTTKGTMLQLMFMIIAYIVLDLIVKYEIL
jgi:hypothetical protein